MKMDANEIFQKGISCHQNGEIDKAINYYKEAIRIAPNMYNNQIKNITTP